MDHRAPVGDMAADMVLQHLLGSFHQPKSYDLALKWLYRLFVANAGIGVTSAAKAAASAHITQPKVTRPPFDEYVIAHSN